MAPPRRRRVPPDAAPAPSRLQKMRVGELQKACQDRGLSAAGNKADLVRRILAFHSAASPSPASLPRSPDPDPPPRQPQVSSPRGRAESPSSADSPDTFGLDGFGRGGRPPAGRNRNRSLPIRRGRPWSPLSQREHSSPRAWSTPRPRQASRGRRLSPGGEWPPSAPPRRDRRGSSDRRRRRSLSPYRSPRRARYHRADAPRRRSPPWTYDYPTGRGRPADRGRSPDRRPRQRSPD
jgi:hypothetical protein